MGPGRQRLRGGSWAAVGPKQLARAVEKGFTQWASAQLASLPFFFKTKHFLISVFNSNLIFKTYQNISEKFIKICFVKLLTFVTF